jgi:hypothetical protein
MALLTASGKIIFGRQRNANADMTGIKASKRPKFIQDMSALQKRELKRLERLEAKLRMRKDIDKFVHGR